MRPGRPLTVSVVVVAASQSTPTRKTPAALEGMCPAAAIAKVAATSAVAGVRMVPSRTPSSKVSTRAEWVRRAGPSNHHKVSYVPSL